jgi:hypothetical protein
MFRRGRHYAPGIGGGDPVEHDIKVNLSDFDPVTEHVPASTASDAPHSPDEKGYDLNCIRKEVFIVEF